MTDHRIARRAVALLMLAILTVVAALTLSTGPASADTGTLAGTRVAASNLPGPDAVGPRAGVVAGQGRETTGSRFDFALGCCVATQSTGPRWGGRMQGDTGAVRLPGPSGEMNWSPKSKPTFGHSFETHGAGPKNTSGLTGRAGGTGQAQGQWLDNDAAAGLLKGASDPAAGPRSIPIPDGMGQVIMPDGSIVPATHATLIPNGSGGYTTAYPTVGGPWRPL